MQNKTIGFLQIEWSGFKRVLIHTGLIAFATLVTYIFSRIDSYNFGSYQAIMTVVMGFVATFLEKWFSNYDVTVTIPSVPDSTTVS